MQVYQFSRLVLFVDIRPRQISMALPVSLFRVPLNHKISSDPSLAVTEDIYRLMFSIPTENSKSIFPLSSVLDDICSAVTNEPFKIICFRLLISALYFLRSFSKIVTCSAKCLFSSISFCTPANSRFSLAIVEASGLFEDLELIIEEPSFCIFSSYCSLLLNFISTSV